MLVYRFGLRRKNENHCHRELRFAYGWGRGSSGKQVDDTRGTVHPVKIDQLIDRTPKQIHPPNINFLSVMQTYIIKTLRLRSFVISQLGWSVNFDYSSPKNMPHHT